VTRINLLTAAAILFAAIATPVSAQQAAQESYQSLGVGSHSTAAANAPASAGNTAPSVNAPVARHVRAPSELPTYEANGLPISPLQVGLLGAANVQEQSPVVTAAASPHQLSVLTPRTKMTTAGAAPPRADRSVR
jgi:hypothetical protein